MPWSVFICNRCLVHRNLFTCKEFSHANRYKSPTYRIAVYPDRARQADEPSAETLAHAPVEYVEIGADPEELFYL